MEIHLTTTYYGVSLAVWDHTVLPFTRHKRTHPAFTAARQAGTRFTDHLRMGCKEQLAHGCYATARASETRTHNLSIANNTLHTRPMFSATETVTSVCFLFSRSYCYWRDTVVCLSVCLSVCHTVHCGAQGRCGG